MESFYTRSKSLIDKCSISIFPRCSLFELKLNVLPSFLLFFKTRSFILSPQNCEFTKNFSDTSLHVYFAGNLRIYGCDGCCSRWYFTFNGAECSSPGPIEGAFYMRTGKNQNLHRHRHIEGHCNNIHKGKVRVGFWVGNCNTGHANANAYTGWATLSRIFVQEVTKAQQ